MRQPIGSSNSIRNTCSFLLAAAAFGITPAHAALTISSAATQNVTCSADVCAPNATQAVLNVGDLENLLASGNVEVTTTGSGVQAKDIVVKAALTWSASNALALDAYRSITVDQPVSVEGLSGLTLTTNDGGQNGELSFGRKGNIAFANLSSGLVINGAAYTLENTVQGLANAIAANPGGTYALAVDYDAAHDGTYTMNPIFDFFGTLEGLGHSISRLKLADSASGFIAGMGAGSEVRDLVLARLVANVRGSFAGLVVGSYGVIAHCGVSGSINEKAYKDADIGGLTVSNSGTILESWSSVTITGRGRAHIAGLVAINDGLIERSFATGSIALNTKLGAIMMGGLVAASNPGSTIVDSYAEVSITGVPGVAGMWAGGLDGGNQSVISTSYATGSISDITGGDNDYAGGLIGYDQSADGSLSDTYWDLDTSGIANPGQGAGNISNDPGITGLTSAQLQSGLPAGFDPKVWAENPTINNGFPYLIANPPRK